MCEIGPASGCLLAAIKLARTLSPKMSANRTLPILRFFSRVCALALVAFVPICSSNAEETGPSGLPLPRFVSTRSAPINVRVGPGTQYEIHWVFSKPGLPVEIVQEYDTWRKIRYVDGDEGWIHQSLLISRRTALVEPFGGAAQAALRARAEDDAPLRAWLETGRLVSVDKCIDGWCRVASEAGNGTPAVSGSIMQIELWGVYPDEKVN
jgi:SH3-like domain-containing protein